MQREFKLLRPRTIDEAIESLSADGALPHVLAGGTDLVPRIAMDAAATVVSLDRVDALRQIARSGNTLTIGSMVTHRDGASPAVLDPVLPGLASAWRSIANPRIRARATIGGNLMARQDRYEGAVLLGALDAQLLLASAAGTQFCAPLALSGRARERELLVAIEVPLPEASVLLYDRSMRPYGSFALALASAAGEYTGRVVMGTERQPPFLLPLALERITNAAGLGRNAAAIAAHAASQLPDTAGDIHASADYRRELARVMIRRLLEQGSKAIP